MEEKIGILVVDDEPDIRRICRILLEAGGYSVCEAATGLEAVQAIRHNPDIDLILMDIMMPDLNGYDACSQIRAYSTAPVLFLTAKTQENDKRRAYDAGGDDYLAKPFSHAELMMKVESLLRRYRVYKNKSSGRMLRPGIVLDEENRRVLLDGAPLELTETEFSILQCLAQNRGRVVPVRTIYETVWHETYMPASNNTVMVHIVNLRKKLEEDPANPRLIRTVWGKGYQIDWRVHGAAGRERGRGGHRALLSERNGRIEADEPGRAGAAGLRPAERSDDPQYERAGPVGREQEGLLYPALPRPAADPRDRLVGRGHRRGRRLFPEGAGLRGRLPDRFPRRDGLRRDL